jgi:radical SAM protein (TIGR01212 family)
MQKAKITNGQIKQAERYFAYSRFLRERFGEKVVRVTLDAGYTCPNVDGTVTTGGCVYCDNRSFSPNRRLPRATLGEQMERGIALLSTRYKAKKYLAYFQAGTNTHGPVEKLRRQLREVVTYPGVVGLIVATRPDSVPDPVLDMLQEFSCNGYVGLELGLQSIHEKSLNWMNRGHGYGEFVDAVARCQGRQFDLCGHVILDLPGESHPDMMETAKALGALPVQGVKIHNLHVVQNTPLEDMYRRGEVILRSREEYAGLVCDFLERLPPSMVIHRLTGDAPPDYLVAPMWCLEKQNLLQHIRGELERRDTWQGKYWSGGLSIPSGPPGRVSLGMIAP